MSFKEQSKGCGSKSLNNNITGLRDEATLQNSPQKPKYTNLEQKLYIKSLDSGSNLGISFWHSVQNETFQEGESHPRSMLQTMQHMHPAPSYTCRLWDHWAAATAHEQIHTEQSLFSPTAKPYPETLRQIFKSHSCAPTYHQSRGTHPKRQNPA